jgi:hypothetical protein
MNTMFGLTIYQAWNHLWELVTAVYKYERKGGMWYMEVAMVMIIKE